MINENDFVIFLDVDGVLNKESDWNKKYYVDKNCVACLQKIIQLINKKKYTAKIVLSSTWRAGMGATSESLQILELKKQLAAFGIEIADATPVSNQGRQREVLYYIRKHNVSNYLIIDDDESLFEDIGKLHFYKPDYKTGLTLQDVKKVKKML